MTKTPDKTPGCSICSNAYVGFVCESCKADPANIGWSEPREVAVETLTPARRERISARPTPWTPARVSRPRSWLFKRVARLLGAGATQRAAAREVGCSRSYVSKVAQAVGLTKRR